MEKNNGEVSEKVLVEKRQEKYKYQHLLCHHNLLCTGYKSIASCYFEFLPNKKKEFPSSRILSFRHSEYCHSVIPNSIRNLIPKNHSSSK